MAFVTRETRAINLTKLLCLYEILGHNQALEKNRKQAQISSFTLSFAGAKIGNFLLCLSLCHSGCVLGRSGHFPPTHGTDGEEHHPWPAACKGARRDHSRTTQGGDHLAALQQPQGSGAHLQNCATIPRKGPSLQIFCPKQKMAKKEMGEAGVWS